MKKLSKFLCVVLSLIIALFAGGCGIVTEDEINSRLDDILSNVQSAFDEQFEANSIKESGSPDHSDNHDSGAADTESSGLPEQAPIDENGSYTTKDDVALYIYTYGKLPKNFITKNYARALGWTGGSLEPYAEGMCIGGDSFGNNEGLLPSKDGRQYTECDIDTLGADARGAKRIVFSNDGLIYYTDDHYESFTLLYGEE